MMVASDELQDLLSRFESLLTDLDRLNFPTVAVHVDFALRRLEEATGMQAPTQPDLSVDEN